jgi:thiol-disulfide isomerase/thioredoxin
MYRIGLAVLLVISCEISGWSQTSPDFPTTNWLNAPPLTKTGMQGKIVVMVFYEEGCPRCREQWPNRIKVAQKYADQPVIFVAVNSGNSPGEVAGYLKSVNCNWPAIVDVDRSFEKACLGKEISLQNIWQGRMYLPNGAIEPCDANDASASIDRALPMAKWKIDPKEIPDVVKGAWQLFEVGQYNNAAGALNAAAKGIKDDTAKAAAEKIRAGIKAEFEELTKAATTAEQGGEIWTAYKTYLQASSAFNNLAEAKELKIKITKLQSDPQVVRQLKAGKLLNDARAAATNPNPATQKRGLFMAQQLVKDYGDTEAGVMAKAALEAANLPLEPMK